MPTPEFFSAFLSDPEISPVITVRAELPKSVLKHLRPLGHEMTLFESAARQMIARLEKGRFEPALAEFLQRWRPTMLPLAAGGDLFSLLLNEGAQGWQLAGSSLDWLNDPTWAALLHLPALRSTWAGDLRASHLEHLRQIVPQAWLMDATPLPPGSVIAGLGIGSWAELPQLIQQRSELVIQEVEGGRAILTEPPAGSGHLLARYRRGEGGIQLDAAWLAEGAEVVRVV